MLPLIKIILVLTTFSSVKSTSLNSLLAQKSPCDTVNIAVSHNSQIKPNDNDDDDVIIKSYMNFDSFEEFLASEMSPSVWNYSNCFIINVRNAADLELEVILTFMESIRHIFTQNRVLLIDSNAVENGTLSRKWLVDIYKVIITNLALSTCILNI